MGDSTAPHFDRLETRSMQSRENALFHDLRAILSIARSRAPALRTQLKGVAIDKLKSRENLTQIPVLRRAHMRQMQAESPPFGGLLATRPSALKRILHSNDGLLHPEGHAKDWWGAARGLHALGFRHGDIVLNACPHHLDPTSFIMSSGIHALGGVVLPTGPGHPDKQLDLATRSNPNAFIGTTETLESLISHAAKAGGMALPFDKILITGTKPSMTAHTRLANHGFYPRGLYTRPELGLIAYESGAHGALIVNEGLIVEIIEPGTNDPVPHGQRGEITVTRLNGDYPLVRFGTGDISAILPGLSACGRTNLRLDPDIEPLEAVD